MTVRSSSNHNHNHNHNQYNNITDCMVADKIYFIHSTYPIKVDFRVVYTLETFSLLLAPSTLISPMEPTRLMGLLGSSPSGVPPSFVAWGGMLCYYPFDFFFFFPRVYVCMCVCVCVFDRLIDSIPISSVQFCSVLFFLVPSYLQGLLLPWISVCCWSFLFPFLFKRGVGLWFVIDGYLLV